MPYFGSGNRLGALSFFLLLLNKSILLVFSHKHEMCVREVSCFFGWGDVFQYTTRGVTKSITNSALIYGSLHVDGVTARGASGWLDSGGS